MKPRRLEFFGLRCLSRNVKLAGLFSLIAHKKRKSLTNFRHPIDDVKFIPYFLFFSPAMLGHRTRITNAVRCDASAWFFDGKRRLARKACYTRAAFVKVTQKNSQVIQVRQFQELRELVPLFLQHIACCTE